MKSLKDKLFLENKESATFTLTAQDLDKILFSLSFTRGWASAVNSNEMKDHLMQTCM